MYRYFEIETVEHFDFNVSISMYTRIYMFIYNPIGLLIPGGTNQ